jgi:lysophospholipase L1-like esterase
VAAVVLVAVLAVALSAGCTRSHADEGTGPAGSASSSATPSPSSGGTADPGRAEAPATVDTPLTFTVVGDSITAGSLPIEGTAVPGTRSWLPAALGPPLEFQGGWAVPGATTQDMRAGVVPSSADVVVVLAGTNDLFRLPWEVTADDLRAIVATVGVPRVLLSAIPPFDVDPAQAQGLNRQLADLAAAQGWRYVDPWEGISVDGAYAPGTSADGVHPTQEVADVVGRRLRAELVGLR